MIGKPSHLRGAWALLSLLVAIGCSRDPAEQGPSVARISSVPAKQTGKPVSLVDLRKRIDTIIEFTGARHLNPKVNNAWHIVHGLLAFGHDLRIEVDGRAVPALDWLLAGGEMKGWDIEPGEKGLVSKMDPGTKAGQGHPDQWLGYLSQSGIGPDTRLILKGETFKVADLISQAQWDIRDGMEGTWTLMALGTYLSPEATWRAKDGGEWSLERLIAMESEQDLAESACGGSHRMYSIATALKRYREGGGPLTGGWKKAHSKVQQAIQDARRFQGPDGGFSTRFFQEPLGPGDLGLRISTTGHVLEFLCVALSDDELREDWVTSAVVYLSDLLEATRTKSLECGGLYHAAHSLKLYRARRFGSADSPVSASGAISRSDAAPVIPTR